MASYRVVIKPSAAKEIEAVDKKKDRQRIVATIRELAGDPRPVSCEKLAERATDTECAWGDSGLCIRSPTMNSSSSSYASPTERTFIDRPMKKTRRPRTKTNRMRGEYDFSSGVRGKYAERYESGTSIVVLEPGIAELFPTSRDVNDALRTLATKRSRRTVR